MFVNPPQTFFKTEANNTWIRIYIPNTDPDPRRLQFDADPARRKKLGKAAPDQATKRSGVQSPIWSYGGGPPGLKITTKSYMRNDTCTTNLSITGTGTVPTEQVEC